MGQEEPGMGDVTVRGDRTEREDLGEDEMGLKGLGFEDMGLDLFELSHGFA